MFIFFRPKKLKAMKSNNNEKESSIEEEQVDEELEMKGEENLINSSKRTNKPQPQVKKSAVNRARSLTSSELDNRSDNDAVKLEEVKKEDSSSVDEEELNKLGENKTRDSPSPSIGEWRNSLES